MESIVRELISLDQKAKSIVAPAENEQANLEAVIRSKSAEILMDINANIAVKIAQMRASTKECIELKEVEIDNEIATRLAEIEAEWSLNADKWRDEIFSAVITYEI